MLMCHSRPQMLPHFRGFRDEDDEDCGVDHTAADIISVSGSVITRPSSSVHDVSNIC